MFPIHLSDYFAPLNFSLITRIMSIWLIWDISGSFYAKNVLSLPSWTRVSWWMIGLGQSIFVLFILNLFYPLSNIVSLISIILPAAPFAFGYIRDRHLIGLHIEVKRLLLPILLFSPLVAFLDSDDQLKPNFVSRMTNRLKQNKESSAVVCLSSLLFSNDFPAITRWKIISFIALRNLGLLLGYALNNGRLYPSSFYFCQLSHMVFRRSVANKSKFNYDYRRGGEDWDFVISAQKYGPIEIIPQPLLHFYYSPGSSTFTPINQKLKWQSYLLLISRLPKKLTKGLFYRLFLLYIKQYGPKGS